MDVTLECADGSGGGGSIWRRAFRGGGAPGRGRALHQRTDGQPVVSGQVVDALVRQGRSWQRRGRLGVPGGLAALDAAVPESLRQLIEQQFESSARGAGALEAASVAGLEWAVAAVAAGGRPRQSRSRSGVRPWRGEGSSCRREGWEWPDGTVAGRYEFRHGFISRCSTTGCRWAGGRSCTGGLARGWRRAIRSRPRRS